MAEICKWVWATHTGSSEMVKLRPEQMIDFEEVKPGLFVHTPTVRYMIELLTNAFHNDESLFQLSREDQIKLGMIERDCSS